MKQKTIRLFATQIPYTEEELEENEVYVEFSVGELLDEIDNEDIEDYARWRLDMKHEDEFESSLDDFDEDDLVKELENSGYTIIADKDVVGNGLDYVDAQRLWDIQRKFIDSSWDEKLVMYNKIFNL